MHETTLQFKIGAEDDPVEKLFEMEDLHVKLNNAGMSVDSNTLYACFVSALPAAEYSLEIRDLNLKQIYDRKEIINLVRSKYETLLPSFGKSKGSSKSHALVGKGGGGFGGKGGKHMGVGKGLAKAGKATASPVRKVEPGTRGFRRGGVSDARLRATTATIAPQSSAKDVAGEGMRAASTHRRRTWTYRRRMPYLRWWGIPEMVPWRRRRFRGTAVKAPRWEYNRGHPRRA